MEFIGFAVVLALVVISWIAFFKVVRSVYTRVFKSRPKKEALPEQEAFKPLTREQRKGLVDVLGPIDKQVNSRWVGSAEKAKPASSQSTRAIREDWSIGEVMFTYRDAEGSVSHRHLIVHSVSDTYIKGECLDNNAERTFRLDRIIGDLDDCETNEAVAPIEYALSKGADLYDDDEYSSANQGRENLQILFTGFKAADRAELEGQAADYGLQVMKTVAKNLNFLCAGPNAGPAKVKKALEGGAIILTEDELLFMLETGALPS